MPDVLDPYAVLGLNPGTPIAQVKAQFRSLAMAIHPDRNANDLECQERLKHINAAYEFLADAARKREYDARYFTYTDWLPQSASPVEAPFPIQVAPQAAQYLRLALLCLVLAGIVVAAVILAGSAQSVDRPASVPAITVIELSPNLDKTVPSSREDGISLDAGPSQSDPIGVVPAQPTRGQDLWPSGLSGSSVAPAVPRAAPPVSGATPSTTVGGPS